MTATGNRDRSLVLFGLLAIWILIELLSSSRWLAFRPLEQQPVRHDQAPNRLANLLKRSTQQGIPRVWFAPYTTFPEPANVESRFRGGPYDSFLAFPPGGLASNYGTFKLGPADLLFSQASSQGLAAEAQLASDLHYDSFALDVGAIDPVDQAITLCKQVRGCQLSQDGYALFPLNHAPGTWIQGLDSLQRRIKEFPQRAAGYRWAGLVLRPGEWFVPDKAALLLRRPGRPAVRIWALPLQSNSLYVYRDQDLPAAVASRLQTRLRRLWLTLAPGVAGADLCLHVHVNRPCLPLRLRQAQPRLEITRLVPAGRVSSIDTLALYGAHGQGLRLDQLPPLPGTGMDRAIYGIEIQ